MTFGLRITLTEKDKAAFAALATRAPHLVDAPWQECAGAGWVGIFCEGLSEELAFDLKQRGVDVVRLGQPRTNGAREAVPVISDPPTSTRPARGLIEAVRPISVGDAVPAEAIFVARVEGGGAQQTLERLLMLERDDVQVGEIETGVGTAIVMRVPHPPLYLLFRAREEPNEGVRVFARSGNAQRVYTTWGTAHPLAALLEDRLARADKSALIDAKGSITLTSSVWSLKPILDAVKPDLTARKDALEATGGQLVFPVRMRFGPSEPVDPELWVLTPEQLFKLESFVDTSPADEVGRLLVSRVADLDGRARYVLREAVRPQLTRLGPRIGSIVGAPGFARAPTLDNLYLPPTRRLVPALSREQIKALLGLDAAAAVIVDEDSDGLKVTSIKALEDAPLSRFTTWVATDRRDELDRLLEDAVLSFPGVTIEKPAKKEPLPDDDELKAKAGPKSPKEKPPPRPVVTQAERTQQVDGDRASSDVAAMRRQARELEEQVLGERAADGAAWTSLGRLKAALDEGDDACACLEVAAFLGADASPDLVPLRAAQVPRRENGEEQSIVDLAVADRLTREQTGLLGARVLQALAHGEPLIEDVLQQTTQLFLKEDLIVSRRLQWAVLHAICSRAKDALGATRAKEAVLGALNARGLSETLDLPRFVRTALALLPGDDGGAAPIDRTRHEQLVQLEKLFGIIVAQPLKLTDSKDAFFRAIFAVGLGRLGGRGPEVVRALQAELDAHTEAPNRALLRLYIARMSHFVTKGSIEAWKKEVDAVLAGLARAEERRVVEWLVKRSLWLRPAPPEEPPMGLRPALERHLANADKRPEDLPSATARVQDMPGLYDYEVATAIERLLRAALASGRDELIHATLLAAMKVLVRIRIAAHRVRALGACVRAAATLDDGGLVDQCLDGIAAVARGPNVPMVRDLLIAVKPALAALRRLGAVDAAQRFLASLEPVAAQHDRETGPLLAAISDGFLQLGDVERAKALVAQALARAMHVNTAPVDRYDAAVAVLEALTHWDLESRARECGKIISDIAKFTDTFTTNRFFATHQLLIAERVVETLVDDVTFRGDRLQAYLDGEEQAIRRSILQQWSALCGR